MFFISRHGRTYGPYTRERLVEMVQEGSVSLDDVAHVEGGQGSTTVRALLGDSELGPPALAAADQAPASQPGAAPNKEAPSDPLVLRAFVAMAGDPAPTLAAAAKYASVDSWVTSQATQVGLAGGAAMAIPYVHFVGLAADLMFLMHKLGVTCWGIGELKGCLVLGKADFANILALWSGAATLQELDRKAISKASFETIVLAGGGTVAGYSAAAIAAHMTGQQLAMLGGQVAGSLIARKAIGKGATQASTMMAGRIGGKLGAKAAGKAAAKFTAKLGAKALAGIVPCIGPAVAAGINVYFVRKIAKAAIAYYDAAA